jgi:hypothetical protein
VEPTRKCATSRTENVCAAKATVDHVAINACPDITTTRIVFPATARALEARQRSAMPTANVAVWRISLAASVPVVWLAFTTTRNVCRATVTITDLSAFPATMKDSASVNTTLTVSRVTSVRRASTISRLARSVTVTRLVLLPSLLVVAQCPLGSCVSVRNEFRDVFVTNVGLCTGT